MKRPACLLLCTALAVLAACGGGGDGGGGSGGTGGAASGGSAAASAPGDLSKAAAKLVKVADVASPTAMAVRANDDALYVAEKTGRVRRLPKGQTENPGAADGTPVLDLSGQVSAGGEQGLLGIVFSPDGSKLYVDYTDRDGDTRVVEYAFDAANGRADTGSRRELLMVDQPFANHNGGEVAFGPDGMLYIGLGDGGSGNDPGNRAQNLGDLLGKLLRVNPAPSGRSAYTVPPDNPFVGRSGARPEIWAYGLRNPWRFSWDRATKDLWIGDVGQDAVEEIDFLAGGAPAGANFGWSLLEGSRQVKGANPAGAVLPIFEYGHGDGCSVTGGYAYRGAKVPSLRGVYVYGDACSGKIWGLVQSGGKQTGQRELDVSLPDRSGRGRYTISSFGEDGAGELYLLNLAGSVYRFESG